MRRDKCVSWNNRIRLDGFMGRNKDNSFRCLVCNYRCDRWRIEYHKRCDQRCYGYYPRRLVERMGKNQQYCFNSGKRDTRSIIWSMGNAEIWNLYSRFYNRNAIKRRMGNIKKQCCKSCKRNTWCNINRMGNIKIWNFYSRFYDWTIAG